MPKGRCSGRTAFSCAARPSNEGFINAKVLTRVLVAIVEAWDANWGVIETLGYERLSRHTNGQVLRPWGGWITYLSARYASRIAPPAAARAERRAGGGLVIAAMEAPFTVANPAHVAALDAIQQALAPIQA